MEPIQLDFKDYFPFFLILTRIGGLFFTAPGVGERFIPVSIRILVAVSLSIILQPFLADKVVKLPDSPFALMITVMIELFIGLFTGLVLRTIFSTLHIAGAVIGYHIGMMNAFTMDPNFGEQASLPAVFLSTTAVFLIFATNVHHHIIQSIIQSYSIIAPNDLPTFSHFLGDTSRLMTDAAAISIRLGVQLSGPFILLALLLYAGLGVLNRLLPQVQIFFVVQPLIIFLGLVVLVLVIPLIFPIFMDRFDQFTKTLWAP